jgi:hypothetical protein
MQFGCGRYQFDDVTGDGAFRSSVYAVGTKKLHVVYIDVPVRVVSVPKTEERYMTPLYIGNEPYPLERACREMLRAGETKGITQRARALLTAAKEAAQTEEEELESMSNENPAPEGVNTEANVTQETTVKKPKSKKPRKTATKKPAKAAKPAKKGGAKKTAAPRDPLGREGSLARFLADKILEGLPNDKISTLAKKKFPDSKSTEVTHVSWQRFNLKRRGIKLPAVKE